MRKKRMIKFLLIAVVLIGAAGFYIYREYNRTHTDTEHLQADYSLQATAIINEFVANEKKANEKYWDKVIHVQGIVKEVNKDERGLYALAIGDTALMSSVRCTIDSLHSNEAKALKPGDKIGVKGICSGFNADELLGSDVVLVRCVIENK